MNFTKNDFCAIMQVGKELDARSNNPQSMAAARKLVYGIGTQLPHDQLQSVLLNSKLLDFESAVATISTLGEDEKQWASRLLYATATVDGEMTPAQSQLWAHLQEYIAV